MGSSLDALSVSMGNVTPTLQSTLYFNIIWCRTWSDFMQAFRCMTVGIDSNERLSEDEQPLTIAWTMQHGHFDITVNSMFITFQGPNCWWMGKQQMAILFVMQAVMKTREKVSHYNLGTCRCCSRICYRKMDRVVMLNFFSHNNFGNLDCNVSPEIGVR
jgi:hypothetical protein